MQSNPYTTKSVQKQWLVQRFLYSRKPYTKVILTIQAVLKIDLTVLKRHNCCAYHAKLYKSYPYSTKTVNILHCILCAKLSKNYLCSGLLKSVIISRHVPWWIDVACSAMQRYPHAIICSCRACCIACSSQCPGVLLSSNFLPPASS